MDYFLKHFKMAEKQLNMCMISWKCYIGTHLGELVNEGMRKQTEQQIEH